jgi:16S rRNA G966 N2-methylase RsmD
MKYMGSKRAMLKNGLGEAIEAEISHAVRFVDLFTGSGVVAWFAATRWPIPVVAGDLQFFAAALADAVIGRTSIAIDDPSLPRWIERARTIVEGHPTFLQATAIQDKLARKNKIATLAREGRILCKDQSCGAIQSAYGGYYFSPLQALWFDGLRKTLPRTPSERKLGLGALIQTASHCAASPGHTAQPFKPNDSAGPFLSEAWNRSVTETLFDRHKNLGALAALRVGTAFRTPALELAKTLKEGDLAFIDPPYSGVHYSRFYHVLETLSVGKALKVVGEGRYPAPSYRPRSEFSIASQSAPALEELFKVLGNRGVRGILTFPVGQASNGLSGQIVIDLASIFFKIKKMAVTSRFSTLGGNRILRAARSCSEEMILRLVPRG